MKKPPHHHSFKILLELFILLSKLGSGAQWQQGFLDESDLKERFIGTQSSCNIAMGMGQQEITLVAHFQDNTSTHFFSFV